MSSNTERAIEELIGAAPAQPRELALGGAYEGASQYDRQVSMWQPGLQSADLDILPDKDLADARVNDMIRNDGYVHAGAQLHKDNIVGHAYFFNSKPNLVALGMKDDEAWETEFQEELESKFALAAESPECWLDTTRSQTLTGMVRLAIGTYAAGGEVLASAEYSRSNAPRPFRTSVNLVDSARLRTPFDLLSSDHVRGGIRKDADGAASGYYIYKRHPNDIAHFGRGYDTINDYQYIKARRSFGAGYGRLNIIHLFEATRPGQTRGISDIVTGLKELKITKSFREVTLQNAVVNAMFAATIESEMPPEAVVNALGGQAMSNPAGAAVDYASQYLSAVGKYSSGAKSLQMDGARIPHLFPGTKLNMKPAGTPGGVGQDFEKSLIRYLSAILGVSYEQLSHDYSETNYSSARAAMTETWKFMMSRKRMVADRFAQHVLRLWFEEQVNAGEIESMKYAKLPNMYDGMNFDAFTAGDWIGAARGQIDELKETQAAVLRMKYHLSTQEEEQAKLGKDWRKGIAQSAREKRELDSRGLAPEESNAINAASGAPREKTEVEDNGQETNDREHDT